MMENYYEMDKIPILLKKEKWETPNFEELNVNKTEHGTSAPISDGGGTYPNTVS